MLPLIFILFLHPFLLLAHPPLASPQRPDGLCALLVLPYHTYSCQEFVVQTGNGFLVGVQRMSSTRFSGDKKGPVLLYHGIFQGGDVWVLNSPDEALGFILADQGYDVWIGNFRSTMFSYGHILYQRRDKGFWDWSVDELASEDLPSILELIYTNTGQKINLIGYSEGSQAALAALSQGLGVEHLNKMVLLAPIAYVTSGPQLVEIVAKIHLQKIYDALRIYEISTRIPGGRQDVDVVCAASSARCFKDWIQLFTGYVCCVNATRRPFIDLYESQATSVKNLEHYAQQMRTGTFGKYDYGMWGNARRYGWATPPAYDLSKVRTEKMLIINGDRDAYVNKKDMGRLVRELRGGFVTRSVRDFGHLDFVLASNAKTLVYNMVTEFLSS